MRVFVGNPQAGGPTLLAIPAAPRTPGVESNDGYDNCQRKRGRQAHIRLAWPPLRSSLFLGHCLADAGDRFHRLCADLLSGWDFPRAAAQFDRSPAWRAEEHTSELQ